MNGDALARLRRVYYSQIVDDMYSAVHITSYHMKSWYRGRMVGTRWSLRALDRFADTLLYFEHGNGD